jgi:HAE1 family hydrophobic/amphiphilic exporter-1
MLLALMASAVGQNSTTRVGVDPTATAPITLQEAIRLALQNNNDISTSRIDVELSEHELTAARGAYDPGFKLQSRYEHSRVPLTSFFGGTNGNSLQQNDFTSGLTFSGLSPRAGGSYEFGVSSTRLSSNNFFNDLNPSYATSFNISYTQPLLRGRRIDDTRRKIEIAKRNLSLTDIQFRQRVTDVISRVEEAYWQLVYSLRNLQVQNEAVNQTTAQVESNRRQVEQGILAPIDVVEAEAQVKIFEQNAYAAQEDVTRAENALKTLLLPDRTAELWSRPLLPMTAVDLEAPRLPLEQAIATALANRLELAELRTSRDINDINKAYFRDQTKPQLDVTVGYSSNGLAGALNNRDENPIFAGISSLEKRVAELSTLSGLPALPATSFAPVPGDLRGGYGASIKNLLGQNNPTVSFGVTISLPLRNRTAKAQLAHSSAEERRLDVVKMKTEQMIEADVRNAMQALQSVQSRMAAAAASRTAADQQYTSEKRKFQAGMSTLFLVLQRQTDLVTARGRELQTQTDLNKAIAELQRAMGNTLQYRNVSVISDGHRLQQVEAVADR